MEIFPSVRDKMPVYEVDINTYLTKENMENGDESHRRKMKIVATCGSDIGTWIRQEAEKEGFKGEFEEDHSYVSFVAQDDQGRYNVYTYHEIDSIDRVVVEDAVALIAFNDLMKKRKG